MWRKTSILICAIALLLAAEPLLHQHPLRVGSGINEGCVVCAAGVNRLPSVAVAIHAPQVIVYSVQSVVVTAFNSGVTVTSDPRGPPAA